MSNETSALMAKNARERGFEYTAQYIEKFGADKLNPAFIQGFNAKTEEFYKKCVTEGHPFDYYFEFPDNVMF